MQQRRLVPLLGQMAILLVMTIFIVRQEVDFKSDILSSLPEANTVLPILEAEQKLFQQASTKVILSFSGDNKEKAYDAFLAFSVLKGWQPKKASRETINQIADFYVQYKGLLLTQDYKDKIKSTSSFSQYFAHQLSRVSNPIMSATIEQDPSLATASYLESLLSQHTSLTAIDERLVAYTHPETPLVMIINVVTSDADTLRPILNIDNTIKVTKELKNQQAILIQQFDVEIKISGILLHNAENAENAKWEMGVFGTISMVATLLLVVFAFRSLTPLLWIFMTIVNAVLAGLCALALAFDSIHVITLVFGLSIIGLSVDYCLHVLAGKSMQSDYLLMRTLIFAFITTAFSYALFLFTPLMILKQVAVFVCVGLLSALLTSYCFTRQPLSFKASSTAYLRRMVNELRKRLLTSQKPIAIIAICVIGYSVTQPLSFDDNVATLNASSSSLIAAEKYNRALIEPQSIERVFLFHHSLQTLLEQEELLVKKVIEISSNAQINKLSNWLPSNKMQQTNFTLFNQAETANIFSSAAEFVDVSQLSAHQKNLEYEHLVSELGEDMVEHLYQQVSNAHVSIVEIKGLDKADVESIISTFDNMLSFDKQTSLSQVLTNFRIELGYWLVSAVLAILAIFFIRFDWQSTVKAAFALITSIYCALVISQIIQETLNVFNLLSAILVIGLAVDYLIFYRARKLSDANILAISLSAASSLFVFGMLAFSQTPAIKSFGITVTFGLVFIYILAPLVVKESHERRNI